MLGRCIICRFGPVDLPSLIGSSSTAEPLTAMHCSPLSTRGALPNPDLPRGNMLWPPPPISRRSDTRRVLSPSVGSLYYKVAMYLMYGYIAMRALSTRVSHSHIRCCYLIPYIYLVGRARTRSSTHERALQHGARPSSDVSSSR